MNLKANIFFSAVLLGISLVYAGTEEDSSYVFGFTRTGRLPFECINKVSVITLAAVGDVMLGGGAAPFLKTRGADYPFREVKDVLLKADIVTFNLEAPFTINGRAFKKKFTFKVDPGFAESIVHAGFDVASLANNHILDFGEEGLVSTLKVLDSLKIAHTGAGLNREEAEKPAVIKRNGKSVGFLSYSLTYPSEFWAGSKKCGTAYPSFNRVRKSINDLKSRCDFVVVQFHWGSELRTTPKSYQKWFAHASIDAGADIVIGHHPHVLQGIEIYKGRLIAYSLGNFVFGSYSRKVKDSIILKIWFDKKGPLLSEVIPVSVNNYRVLFKPEILRTEKKKNVVDMIERISAPLNHGQEIISNDGLIIFNKKDVNNE